jgi:uncharacterized protein YbjT (DUF2867 family)
VSALSQRSVLVTGATGFVASRLIPALVQEGATVRATSRSPEEIVQRHPSVEAIASDLLDQPSLERALQGIDVAYYLVHSMSGAHFQANDRAAAANFLQAAEHASVERIVYLSGLGVEDPALSSHLRSRHEVGRRLASGTIPVTELRAAIVIGSGSVAFDMLRYLTERLPLMVAPRWLSTRIQPISEDDLTLYLLAAGVEDRPGGIVEIGGRDVLTYRDMILRYAAERALRRRIFSVPVLSPRLSSYWVDLMTPVRASIARPLIDGLRNEVIVTNQAAAERYPHIEPMGYDDAVRRALARQEEAIGNALVDGRPAENGASVGLLIDDRQVDVGVAPEDAAVELYGMGGDPSWYPLGWAWWIRARLDSIFGGVGLKWAKPVPALQRGAIVDWWKVDAVRPHALWLRAQMKTPGEAWLALRVSARSGGSSLRQVAVFRPRGLRGRLYWWGLLPFHAPIFRLMAERLGRRMEGRV